MKTIRVVTICLCLFGAISCQKMATKTPAVQSVEWIDVKDLLEFRKTPEFKNISAVMVEAGYNGPMVEAGYDGPMVEAGYDGPSPEILFAIGDEKLISQ